MEGKVGDNRGNDSGVRLHRVTKRGTCEVVVTRAIEQTGEERGGTIRVAKGMDGVKGWRAKRG